MLEYGLVADRAAPAANRPSQLGARIVGSRATAWIRLARGFSGSSSGLE
jgi:hypothetical protein